MHNPAEATQSFLDGVQRYGAGIHELTTITKPALISALKLADDGSEMISNLIKRVEDQSYILNLSAAESDLVVLVLKAWLKKTESASFYGLKVSDIEQLIGLMEKDTYAINGPHRDIVLIALRRLLADVRMTR